MELTELACKIFDSFDYLKKILSDKGYSSNDRIVVFDDPLEIIIKRDAVIFVVDGEEEGIITRNQVELSERVREEAIQWLESLSFLKFKRYSLKKK
jgi:hypothetical protein